MSMIVVKAAFDAEADVWYVESSDLPGLNAEAATVQALRDKIEIAIVDLLQAPREEGAEFDIPVEIIAHASGRARVRSAA